MSETTTAAPAAPKRSAIARPHPVPPDPVTTTTRGSSARPGMVGAPLDPPAHAALVCEVCLSKLAFQIGLFGCNHQALQQPRTERDEEKDPEIPQHDRQPHADQNQLQVHRVAADTKRFSLDDLGRGFPWILALPVAANKANSSPAQPQNGARHRQCPTQYLARPGGTTPAPSGIRWSRPMPSRMLPRYRPCCASNARAVPSMLRIP